MFICSMSFTTFTVDVKLVQNRLQLSFILLLTTITFKYSVNQALPKISYLTYLVRIACPVAVVQARLALKLRLVTMGSY